MATPAEVIPGHVHTYKRVLKNGKKSKIFACTHPHCPTTRNADFLVGKAAMCPYCNREFVITRMKLHKQGLLHCDDCSRSGAKTTKVARLEDALARILIFGVRNDITPVQDVEAVPTEAADDTRCSNS